MQNLRGPLHFEKMGPEVRAKVRAKVVRRCARRCERMGGHGLVRASVRENDAMPMADRRVADG